MQTIIRIFSLVGALLIIHHLNAQSGDLTQDRDFFEGQSEIYQKWLHKSGLGEHIKVHELAVETNRVSLYLAFRHTNLDTIVNVWDQLEAFYEAQEGLTLEQSLFYKWVNLIEVRQSLVDVQIYDTYDLRREPLFLRAIYYDGGKMQVEKSDPKSKIEVITLRPPNNADNKEAAKLAFHSQMNRENVFQKVVSFAKEKYSESECEGRTPGVKVLDNDDLLRFEVMDLCREVLTDEAQPSLCRILRLLGQECDYAKRELLIFMVSYRIEGDDIKLQIELDGKYGSGMYERVRRGGYLSMEIDFDEYLERYADVFKEELKQYLMR